MTLIVGGVLGTREGSDESAAPTADKHMFRFSHALGLAALISAVVFLAAALNAWLGPRAALLAAAVAASAELHAAGLSIAQLNTQGILTLEEAHWGFIGLLATSAMAKTLVAWVSGGRRYALRVAIGLAAMTVAALAGTVAWEWVASKGQG